MEVEKERIRLEHEADELVLKESDGMLRMRSDIIPQPVQSPLGGPRVCVGEMMT